ncbi:F-box domain-containing protein [Xylariaceae sp. FL0804]|nr:F-box domain-containing protein [Xylariaceae sp. FL0804]
MAQPIANSLQELPDELILHILSSRQIEPKPRALLTRLLLDLDDIVDDYDVVNLQLVSKRFLKICRDNTYWRHRCVLRCIHPSLEPMMLEAACQSGLLESRNPTLNIREKERVRLAANWDPTFPKEKTSWYDEYIQRYGPIAMSWFQQAQAKNGSMREPMDANGVALYSPSEGEHGLFAVSPLEDGSICLWDIKGSRTTKGSILSKSTAGLLTADGSKSQSSKRPRMTNSGVTECVSVDSHRHRAFFAVESRLLEVDLETLAVVGDQPFEWSITSLSAANPVVPLTVGTVDGLHLHDYRTRGHYEKDYSLRVDNNLCRFSESDPSTALNSWPPRPYASLIQAGENAQSILHLERPGNKDELSDDIVVAGRFPNVLHYDRRMFSIIKGSFHSGARLCSLASLPYPFSSVDSELRRHFAMSEEQVQRSKNVPGGRTLIACGEYNTKGSLELYGLSSGPDSNSASRVSCDSATKNRQTASQSKLLSVITHGKRIVFSDGQGYLKWIERDGFRDVRCHKILRSEQVVQSSLFGSMPESDDIARKLLSTRTGPDQHSTSRANDEDILLWTGEKLGLVSFSSKPGLPQDELEDSTHTPPETGTEQEEQLYGERMRLALERQAREVRFVRDLGAGSIRNGM